MIPDWRTHIKHLTYDSKNWYSSWYRCLYMINIYSYLDDNIPTYIPRLIISKHAVWSQQKCNQSKICSQ